MWLLLLLATMVAAVWGIQRVELTGTRSFAPAEIAADSGVCLYTPGHLLAPPTAAEAAQARAAWNDWSQVCRYDPSRGFGAWPTADELQATRLQLGLWGTMDGALAALWTLGASLGLAATGHGLLVGSLSIFNPAFISVGWWLLLPEIALAQGGWLGLAAGAAAVVGLGPRYIRRRTAGEAAVRSRTWLTPKRIGLAAGGWLATVGVLAAVYPNVAALLPKMNPIAAEQGLPAVGSPSTVSGNPTGGDPGAAGTEATIDPVTAAPVPYTPPAGTEAAANPAGEQTAEAVMPSPFGARGTIGASGNGAATGGDAGATGGSGSAAGAPSGEPAMEPINSALQSIASYFPPATAPAGTTPAAPSPGGAPPALPAGAAPPVAATPGTEASSAIAVTPIVDPENPLPANATPNTPSAPSETVTIETPRDPAAEPVADGQPQAPGDEAQPDEEEEEVRPVQPVPEPATLGLFMLGVGGLAMRRRGGNKR